MTESQPWMPIETAPRDGTDVLVYLDHLTVPVVHIAWYNSAEEWVRVGQYCGGCKTADEWTGWWSYTENSIRQSKLEGHTMPTHWMPFHEPR